jgi:FixJ family two-component response regulator
MSGVVGKVSTIAIVDDDESARATMSSFVRSLGFNASAFSSAEEYLLSPQRHHSLCLISDVQMPGMSGLELQTHLAAQGLRVPIIFITAFPNDKVRSRALAQGAVCILDKPFEREALLRCIDIALKSDAGKDR